MVFQAPGQSSKNIAPNCLRDPPRDPPGSVPGGPRRPQEAPRAAQDAARAAQEPPRRPQEATRSDSSVALRRPSGGSCRPRGAQRPPGGHFGTILASFWPSQRLKKQARSLKKRWAQTARLVKGGRRCWRSHSQYNNIFGDENSAID